MDKIQKAELVSLLTQTEINDMKVYLSSLENTIISFRNFQEWPKVKPILTALTKIKTALEDYPTEDKSKYHERKLSAVDDPILTELKSVACFVIWDCCNKLTLISQFLSATKAKILINTVCTEIKEIKAHLTISEHNEKTDNRPIEQIKKEIESFINDLKNERKELSGSRRLREVTSFDESVINRSRSKESLPQLSGEKDSPSSLSILPQRATEVPRTASQWVPASSRPTNSSRLMILSSPTRHARAYSVQPSSLDTHEPKENTSTQSPNTVTFSNNTNTNLGGSSSDCNQKKSKKNIFQKIANHLNAIALKRASRRAATPTSDRKASSTSVLSKSSGEEAKEDLSQRPTSSHSSPPKITTIRPKSQARRSPSTGTKTSEGTSESSGKSPNRSPLNSNVSSPRSSGGPISPRTDDEVDDVISKTSSNPVNKFNLETRMKNFDKYVERYSNEQTKHDETTEGTPRCFDRTKRRAAIYKRTAYSYSQLLEYRQNESPKAELKESTHSSDTKNIWEEEDSPETIRYQTNDKGEKQILAATLNKLVQHLTLAAGCDSKFTNTFLLTYKSFTTPSIFLEKLKQRYRGPPSLSSSSSSTISSSPATTTTVSSSPITESPSSLNSEILKNYCSKEGGNFEKDSETAILNSIQLRVVNVLRRWLDIAFLDFDDKVIADVFEFVDEMRRDRNYHLAEIIDNVLLSKLVGLTKNQNRVFDTPPPPPIIPKSNPVTFDDLDEVEFARQITLRDFELFSSIQASEFLNKAWQEPSLQYRSPRVLKMIHQFNTLSRWVAGVILRCESLKKRVKTMAKFIDIAWELRQMNNFNSMMAIAAGVNHFAVHRLKNTKAELPKSSKTKLQRLEILMSSQFAYKEYRTALKTANPPVIPHLGMYLSDLVFIEDGSPDKVDGLINFRKRRLIAQQIEEIQQFQLKPYNFILIDSIQEFLNNLPEEDNEELYKISLTIEPKTNTAQPTITVSNITTNTTNPTEEQ